MDGLREHHAKWNKSDRGRQILCDITYMWNLKNKTGNSLVDQWLGLHAFTVKGPDSIPGRGTNIPQAAWQAKNKNKNKK